MSFLITSSDNLRSLNSLIPAAAKKKAADEEAERLRQENLKKAEAANAVELEAFKATLSEREKAEFEAGIKLAEQRKVLAEAGRTDMTAIEEQYRISLADIKKNDLYAVPFVDGENLLNFSFTKIL
jgi:predicted transcriptional regulator